ncbi:ABC transporter substrate-binding protein [Streptomyces thioluteus]|uniref:ABC transporter substrate-binding protein n=1 Tax=Streptomyces thioluteus TaxID=66431 RepID=A0ABN3WHI1_STRTU
MEHELGYRVDTVQVDEVPAWDALSQGRGGRDPGGLGPPRAGAALRPATRRPSRDAGPLGVSGHIGWWVPKYFADAHPDVLDWKNLNKYAAQLRTPESGGKGQLLDGSPSYVTHDKALVKNLNLDYQVVFAGSEAAQITQIKQFAKDRKPFLTYWYEPQWLFNEVPMVEVKLPAYSEACGTKGEKDPDSVDCAYPTSELKKYLNAGFSRKGGDAASFLKKFRWTKKDQNEVAQLMAEDKLSAEDAAERWVKRHPDVWKKWVA